MLLGLHVTCSTSKKVLMDNYTTKSELVFNRLLEMIYSGELKTGQKVSAVEIASSLGVSRTPVNEAVKRLSDRNLVTILPNVGFKVTPLPPEEIIDLYELKIVLEGTAIRWINERNISIDFQRLRDLNNEILSALKAGNRREYNAAVRKFHLEFIASVRSKPLLDSFISTWDYSGWEDTLFVEMSPDLEAQCSEHILFLDLLEERKYSEAQGVMEKHGKKWIELFKANQESKEEENEV